MAIHFRYILSICFMLILTQSCSSKKMIPKRILINHHAVCESYTSAMGKGHGIKLTIAINEIELRKNDLTIDSLFIQNKSVIFSKESKERDIILEYSNYYQQAEPFVNADGSVQIEKKTVTEITSTNLVPTYILLHNSKQKFRLDITHFSPSKP